MSVINTNILALTSQNNLTKSQGALGTAIERLSSGMRINSAKDDAAGQAIANRFTANIKGLSQATRNANDGISVAQTTEGSLNEINNNLQRVRELTVQAANGSNSAGDLKSIQAEIGQRLAEINRVSDQTQFNGVKVLASDNNLVVQVGANDNQTISIGLKEITANTLGLNNFTVAGDKTAQASDLVKDFAATGTYTYNVGTEVGIKVDAVSGKVTNNADAQLYVNAASGKINTKATNVAVAAGAVNEASKAFSTAAGGAAGDKTFNLGGATWSGKATDAFGNGTFSSTIDGKSVTVTISESTAAGTASKAAISGAGLYFDETTFAAASSKFTTSLNNETAREVDLTEAKGTKTGGELTVGTTAYTIDAGNGVTAKVGGEAMYISNAGTSSAALVVASKADLGTPNPLAKLDQALNLVDTLRGELGAIQNRFESTITNLSNTVTNLSAARSRIEDANYAVEVSNMTRAQILQQAGTSVLAQANQVPQSVLSLLG